jgi:hypothetical protein
LGGYDFESAAVRDLKTLFVLFKQIFPKFKKKSILTCRNGVSITDASTFKATPFTTGEFQMQIEKTEELVPEFDLDISDSQTLCVDHEYQQSGVTVTLDSDVADDFPSAESVNEALRVLSRITEQYKAELITK